jgi:hypothetical protein
VSPGTVPDLGNSRLGSVPRPETPGGRSPLHPAHRALADDGRPGSIHDRAWRSEIAAALVGAGMLSVLLFPTFAGVLLSRLVRTAPSALS